MALTGRVRGGGRMVLTGRVRSGGRQRGHLDKWREILTQRRDRRVQYGDVLQLEERLGVRRRRRFVAELFLRLFLLGDFLNGYRYDCWN